MAPHCLRDTSIQHNHKTASGIQCTLLNVLGRSGKEWSNNVKNVPVTIGISSISYRALSMTLHVLRLPLLILSHRVIATLITTCKVGISIAPGVVARYRAEELENVSLPPPSSAFFLPTGLEPHTDLVPPASLVLWTSTATFRKPCSSSWTPPTTCLCSGWRCLAFDGHTGPFVSTALGWLLGAYPLLEANSRTKLCLCIHLPSF